MSALTLEEMKANRKLWVEALRSGEYQQARAALKTDDGGMCCLGLLSLLAGCEFVPDATYPGVQKVTDAVYHVAGKRARDFVGLQNEHGTHIDESYRFAALDELNDCGVSFEEIADIIESEPHGLFVTAIASEGGAA